MAGNVWEWVADWYQPDAYRFRKDTNPLGPQDGEFRVLRGGSWLSKDPAQLTTFSRAKRKPNEPSNAVGIRCAYDTSPQP